MQFEVRFSPVVIKHLGISMYSTLPPVLAELITNSYDADANLVTITVNQQKQNIEILDNGCGMDSSELNKDFLYIGRNRREKKNPRISKYNRAVTGKKGLGKLSVFGICESVYVESCKDGLINAFELDYLTLLKQGEDNKPLRLDPIREEEKTTEASYTKIILKNLKRKTNIPINRTAESLMKRLAMFNSDFKCIIKDEKNTQELTKESRDEIIYKGKQFEWKIPEFLDEVETSTKEYFLEHQITGTIFSTEDTLKDDLKGITLFARKKLANSPEFYGVKESSTHAYSYISGTIHVDFIDKDNDEDNITTARNSLIWENDSMGVLKHHLQVVIRKVASQWLEKRRKKKKEKITKSTNFDVNWFEKAMHSRQDKKLAKKITNLVIDSDLDEDKSIDLLQYIEGAFEFETFIDFASDIENNTNASSLLRLLKDWEVIESKEQYRIALGRIETIKKFKNLISNDTKEVGGVDSMHNFLKTFPWILEPRISTFKDEQTYSNILKENFDEETLNIKDRRIDFLCKGFGKTLYVLEIKRSQKTINKADLMQMQDYHEFMQTHLDENKSDRSGYTDVKSYIIGKKLQDNGIVRTKLKTLEQSNMQFLAYITMLDQATEYHREFIDTYEKTNQLSESITE